MKDLLLGCHFSFNCSRFVFIKSTWSISPKKSFDRFSSVPLVFVSKLKKQVLQVIVNHDVMNDAKELKSVEVEKSCIGFCLISEPRSLVKKSSFNSFAPAKIA